MSNGHAFLSCSGANSWINCSAYPRVSSKYPENNTEQAMRGTAAHWVLECVLTSIKAGETPKVGEFLGKDAPNGVLIDAEIIEGVSESINDIFQIIGDKQYLWSTFEIELGIKVERVHPTQCWGTADIVIYDYSNKHLYILDFKFGHVYVEPWENWQLILYAVGALDMAKLDDQQWRVTLNTLQPRCYSATKAVPWDIPAYELRGFANKAATAAENALTENPLATTGSHCKYCPGRHECNAYLRATENALEIACLPQLSTPTPQNVSVELSILERAIEILKARKSALDVQAESYLSKGKDVPGYSMLTTRPRLKWHKDITEIKSLGRLFGVDLVKPEEVITPNQAINKGIDLKIVNRYAKRESGGVKLTQFDPMTTKKAFKRNHHV